jgi:dynein heavy chain
MVCEVQYGGRVTDDFDRRLLGTMGERYFKEQTMKLGANASEYPKGYGPSSLADIAAAKSFVDRLPKDDFPEVFGLHANAELSINIINSGKMFADFFEIQPKDVEAKGSLNFEDIVLACASDLARSMPQDFSSNQYDSYKKKVCAVLVPHDTTPHLTFCVLSVRSCKTSQRVSWPRDRALAEGAKCGEANSCRCEASH